MAGSPLHICTWRREATWRMNVWTFEPVCNCSRKATLPAVLRTGILFLGSCKADNTYKVRYHIRVKPAFKSLSSIMMTVHSHIPIADIRRSIFRWNSISLYLSGFKILHGYLYTPWFIQIPAKYPCKKNDRRQWAKLGLSGHHYFVSAGFTICDDKYFYLSVQSLVKYRGVNLDCGF